MEPASATVGTSASIPANYRLPRTPGKGDLAVAENQQIITPKRIRGVPDLCVEILSESNPDYDRILKFEMYQRCGLPEYWIVDPAQQAVDVYVLADGQHYAHVRCADKWLRPTFIPNVEVDLEGIWRD